MAWVCTPLNVGRHLSDPATQCNTSPAPDLDQSSPCSGLLHLLNFIMWTLHLWVNLSSCVSLHVHGCYGGRGKAEKSIQEFILHWLICLVTSLMSAELKDWEKHWHFFFTFFSMGASGGVDGFSGCWAISCGSLTYSLWGFCIWWAGYLMVSVSQGSMNWHKKQPSGIGFSFDINI